MTFPDNRTSCYQCEGVGRCAGRCEGVFCMKAVHRQSELLAPHDRNLQPATSAGAV